MNNYLEWSLMGLNLTSYYLISDKKKIGFVLGGLGCILALFLFYSSIPLILMYLAFGILNTKGFIQWS